MIKRKTKNGFIFLNDDRSFKSKEFDSREKRDFALEKYVKKQNIIKEEIRLKRKKELELINANLQ